MQAHVDELQVYGRLAARFCPENGVMIDVGANIGLSALTINAAVPSASVHAVEPVPSTFRFLRENLTSHAKGRVTPHQIAISGAEGMVEFHESGDSSASHIIAAGHIVGDAFRNASAKVRATTFDAFVAEQKLERVDFVKIDVEGFEIDVLQGMTETISRFKPVVCMEFNSWTAIAFRDINPRDLLRAFRQLMPSTYRINADGSFLKLTPDNLMTFMSENLSLHGMVDDLIGCADPDRLTGL